MIVTSPSDNGVTLIDNSFIDHYMADANGEFVKIYLYLVRCACPGRDVSVPGIADFFEQTEGDVRRALNYWKAQGLVDLVLDASGQISQIVLRSCSCAPAGAAFQTKGAAVRVTAASVSSETTLPQSGTRSQAEDGLPQTQQNPVTGPFGQASAGVAVCGHDTDAQPSEAWKAVLRCRDLFPAESLVRGAEHDRLFCKRSEYVCRSGRVSARILYRQGTHKRAVHGDSCAELGCAEHHDRPAGEG